MADYFFGIENLAVTDARIGASRRSHHDDSHIHNFAPVARIMKTALPDNAKIAKEAKECMQECVSEFISFITSEGRSFPHSMIMESKIADIRDSIGKMHGREAQDGEWRRHSFCHVFTGI